MTRRLVIDDGRSERELLVVGTMVVGRDPECEISSSDPRLSRRHAELHATPAGVVVRDLGSRNGVRVNGSPITETVLAPGDVVSVAHLTLRLVGEDSPAIRAVVTAPMVVAAPSEDDRTRARPKVVLGPPAGVVPAPAAAVTEVMDDRTRVLPQGARGRLATAAVPTDLGEYAIREAPRVSAAEGDPAPTDVGVQGLLGLDWGRRVLAQGVLLALVVFLMSVIPLAAWQARVFGVSALSSWAVLVPPLGASIVAGAMVAGLIARTAVRESRRDGRR